MTVNSTSLAEQIQTRYGSEETHASLAESAEANAVLHTLLSHRSIRRYLPTPLAPGTLETLVAAAQSASSSSNLQTWSVVALENPAHKAEAAVLCADQEFIREAPLFLVFCADLARLAAISAAEERAGEGIDYLEMFLMASIDAALAAQNTSVAAEALGLGVCYVGAARNQPRELAKLLCLPERVFALFGLTVGVPAAPQSAAIKPRLPRNEVLHRETYTDERRPEQIADYNRVLERFNQGQGRTTPSWSRLSADRVATVEALRGRHLLREILNDRGFGLK